MTARTDSIEDAESLHSTWARLVQHASVIPCNFETQVHRLVRLVRIWPDDYVGCGSVSRDPLLNGHTGKTASSVQKEHDYHVGSETSWARSKEWARRSNSAVNGSKLEVIVDNAPCLAYGKTSLPYQWFAEAISRTYVRAGALPSSSCLCSGPNSVAPIPPNNSCLSSVPRNFPEALRPNSLVP